MIESRKIVKKNSLSNLPLRFFGSHDDDVVAVVVGVSCQSVVIVSIQN